MLGMLGGTIGKLLDRLIPDRAAREAAAAKLAELEQSGELQTLVGQLDINRVEAAHRSLFVAGWRPAVGWICAAAMLNNFIVVPYVGALFPSIQPLDLSVMMPVLLGMLGLAGARTFEKARGAARER